MVQLRVGIITVSDTCSEGKSVDTSGPRLRELVEQTFSEISPIESLIIPDDLQKIEKTLTYFADILKVNLIFTTGGTGFTRRDVTPEATRNVILKEAPQLSLAMSLCSFQKTKYAALSRAICGIRNETLIINLPGSKKAVEECFGAISDVVSHAVDLISEDFESVRHVHKEVQKNGGIKIDATTSASSKHKHVCPHKTGTGGPDDRNSPFPMIEVDAALKIIYEKIRNVEKFEKVHSTMNIPPFRASIKDGYAVKSRGGKGVKRVLTYVSAGDPILNKDLADDECFKINTGAAVPDFADAIVQVEDTKVIESSNGIEEKIEILVDPIENLDIREIGSDLAVGEKLFKSQTFPGIIAYKSLLASIGQKCEVTPNDKVSVCIISTGDELTAPGQPLESGRIYDSNTTMLTALLKNYGFENTKAVIVNDTFSALHAAITANNSTAKFIICSGSVSMGDKDFLKPVLKELNYNIHFGRVNVKPGKPMTFASNQKDNFVFGLPGNPVSAFVCFHLFVLPSLRKCCGYNDHQLSLPYIFVELVNEELELDPRPEYVRAHVIMKNGKFYAHVTQNQISSRLQSIEGADVLLHLPSKTADKKFVKAGDILKASLLRQHFVSSYE